MLRSIVNGVLALAVVGGAYWYLSAERKEGSAELLNTPRPSSLKGPEHARVAKAKATLKTATSPEPASRQGPKVAQADKDSQKDSSNKPFAGLKASSLVKPKAAKPEAAKSKPVKSKTTELVASEKRLGQKKQERAGSDAPKRDKASSKPVASSDSKQSTKAAAAKLAAGARPGASANVDVVTSTPIEGFSLRRVALAHEVENREPTGVATSFDKGTRVHLFMDAKNLSDQDVELVVQWHDAALANPVRVPLKVPARAGRYRTWANSSPIHRPGTHEVSVQVKDGAEIYRKSFSVAAASSSAKGPAVRATR